MKFQKLAEEFVQSGNEISPEEFLNFLLKQEGSYVVITTKSGKVVKACIASKRKGMFSRVKAVELTCSQCQPVLFSKDDLQAIRKNAT